MAHPRGSRVRTFSTSPRAVVRQAEWMVMSQRIANELKPLIKLAHDQGWTIEGAKDNTKLMWKGPNGEGPVYTSYRCQGRDLMNYRAELVRAGLRLDETTAKQHVAETQMVEMVDVAEKATIDQINDAISLLSSSVATMMVKAESFDQVRSDSKEWERIAEEAVQTSQRLEKQAAANEQLIQSIRDCFSLAPWAILPEIAKLLGIDANNPFAAQSLSAQATAPRRSTT